MYTDLLRNHQGSLSEPVQHWMMHIPISRILLQNKHAAMASYPPRLRDIGSLNCDMGTKRSFHEIRERRDSASHADCPRSTAVSYQPIPSLVALAGCLLLI